MVEQVAQVAQVASVGGVVALLREIFSALVAVLDVCNLVFNKAALDRFA